MKLIFSYGEGRMREKGFSLIEFLAVAAVILILAAVCLPNFIRSRTREREAEVKSRIHAIQIALERYAVDAGGTYPAFLVGAERESNILACSYTLGSNGISEFPLHGVTPFAKTADRSAWCNTTPCFTDMDPLIKYCYMSEYPVNPFAGRDAGMWNSGPSWDNFPGIFPYGGLRGDKMFDLGFGWGDTPQTDFLYTSPERVDEERALEDDSLFSDPDNEAPGQFYYHPVFSDLAPVYSHYSAQYESVYTFSNPEISHKVTGYYLYGYGAPSGRGNLEDDGLDVFNRMPPVNDLPGESTITEYGIGDVLFSTVGNGNGDFQERVETTGYPKQEFDPWTGGYPIWMNPERSGEDSDYPRSGPDGVPDWVIIEVTSSTEIKYQELMD